jgi:hypothetical protein
MGRTRAAAQRLVSAHVALLQAELAVTGRELGIIVGLAVGALALALLILVLVWTGTWLFLGEWLFGSIAWGVLFGTLFTIAVIEAIGLNLAGGSLGAWTRGLVAGLVVTVVLSLLFASNVLREAAVRAGTELQASLAIEPSALPTLVGLVVGALVVGIVAVVVGLRVGRVFPLMVVGVLVGALIGLILGSVTFDVPGAIAIGLTIGLITWIGSAGLLAARRGFDPAARYDPLVPRESIAAATRTKEYLVEQLERQRRKVVGR